jgi:hypothetical protein
MVDRWRLGNMEIGEEKETGKKGSRDWGEVETGKKGGD